MRSRTRWALWALAGSLALTGSAFAQVLPRPNNGRSADDTGKAFHFNIKRRSVSGVVKSLDGERKTLVVDQGNGKEIPIDVGPSVIKAGRGGATFGDIQVGDKISVYGESTVQGGLRAMEITLPKERMSIVPKKRTKEEIAAEKAAVKEAKEAQRAAKKAEREAKEAEKKAAKEAKEAEKKAAKEAEAEEKSSDKDDEGNKEEKKDEKEEE